MQGLEKILEEIGSKIAESMGKKREGLLEAENIIRKHMNDGWISVEDLSGCDIELKPCPFCGCDAAMFMLDDRYTARCRSCFCGTGEYKDPERASETWNRRADNETD